MALTDNLASYWKLDESSGNAADSVGGKTLTNNNSVSYASGKINNGADCGSSNTNKSLSNSNVLDPDNYNTGFSIACWVKMNNLGSGYALGFQDSSWSGCFFRINSTTIDFRFGTGVSSDGGGTQVTGLTNSAGVWYHIVMVHTASKNTYYKNGSEIGSRTTGTLTLSGNGTGFALGTIYPNGAYTDAFLDEVGIWTRELTAAEVTTLYNGGNGLQYPFVTTNVKNIDGLAYASIKSKNGLAVASIKNFNGLA